MRRADRLFQIVQLLRRDRVSTAARLARELGISERTLYRDVADLMASGVPIESEAGVGYRLPRHFDLPPFMFNAEEGEALLLGARIVAAWGDPSLREAAESLLRKVEAVLPAGRRKSLSDLPFLVPDFHVPPETARFLGVLRQGLREQRRVRIAYARADGTSSDRVVQPLGLVFWGYRWHLAAWCELRGALRTFRVDRIQAGDLLEAFQPAPGQDLESYLGLMRSDPAARA
ncbi:MAG: YafY family protein [Holophagaceae bacterium]